jgi:XTP/dITP diphosphohydrolase
VNGAAGRRARKFLLATFNRGKVRELRDRLRDQPVEILTFADLSGLTSPVETGATLLENARIKARAALEQSGIPSIADDTGLEIDALGGRPGVRSARYSGPGATDRRNLETVLQQMVGIPHESRRARFRTAMVACFPDQREVSAEGVLEGVITLSPRGTNGFGYDSIFEIADGRTLAELALDEKTRISHRTKALDTLLLALGLARM